MRIALLVLSIGNFGSKGFYNTQEIGLAKALDKYVEKVQVYRLVDVKQNETEEPIIGCKNAVLHLVPARHLGSNGIVDWKKIDSQIDAMVCFSDTQVFFPSVYKWCKKKKIKLLPYIGVSQSHSDNKIKQVVIDVLFNRNIKFYRRLTCFAKTPTVADELIQARIPDVKIAPVGLDVDLLKRDFAKTPISILKEKYGYTDADKVILFIGRMTQEKEPLLMLEIFQRIKKEQGNYKLLMVGNGELSQEVQKKIINLNLAESVQRIERIPNEDIWELYRLSECFVNLNKQEIYGMVLLEAMYYGCAVIAWDAPGPRYLLGMNQSSGFIVNTEIQLINLVLDGEYEKIKSKDEKSIIGWEETAQKIINEAG